MQKLHILRIPVEEFEQAVHIFEGELTASVHATEDDFALVAPLLASLEEKVGRLVFDGYPTGVELCEAINHGGPWPAALGRFTVVGTSSVQRWLRSVSYQNVPEKLLPAEFR